MSAQFTIHVDPARDLVSIRMAGFFTPDDVATFIRERTKAHLKLCCGPNQHLTLNDLRNMKIQPQDAVTAFQEMMGQPEYRSRRLAFVVSATLARAQLMRTLTGRDGVRLFESKAEAEAWLFAEGRQGNLSLRATG